MLKIIWDLYDAKKIDETCRIVAEDLLGVIEFICGSEAIVDHCDTTAIGAVWLARMINERRWAKYCSRGVRLGFERIDLDHHRCVGQVLQCDETRPQRTALSEDFETAHHLPVPPSSPFQRGNENRKIGACVARRRGRRPGCARSSFFSVFHGK